MYKITVKGEAQTDYENLKELDGVDCQDNFAEYFDSDATYADAIKAGYMDFRFENGKLFTYTDYTSERELTPSELEDLKDYTCGQWSDGIGEGFEQYPCKYDDDEEVYVSPWFFGQESTITQTKLS